jgi:hypothetical protein
MVGQGSGRPAHLPSGAAFDPPDSVQSAVAQEERMCSSIPPDGKPVRRPIEWRTKMCAAKNIEKATSPNYNNVYVWRMYNRNLVELRISWQRFILRVAHLRSSQSEPECGHSPICLPELGLHVAQVQSLEHAQTRSFCDISLWEKALRVAHAQSLRPAQNRVNCGIFL